MPESPPNPESTPSGSGQDIVGRMAGEYRLLEKLGEGGFGAVYEAEHPLLRRRAAVKVLHQVAGMDSDAVQRFISEAQAANQIRSRHIVDVFSFGKLPNGRHFYVMDLLDGEPLDRFLRREGHCDVPTTLQLLRPIAEALDAAHAAGVVHRDLKPQNVFLAWEQSGETVPKLLDFGMAKLLGESAVQTVSGVPVGTPLYMSPEQARGEKVDGRTDVYGLGVLCHEMLTGRVPFTAESALAVLVSHLTVPPPRASEVLASVPPELDEPLLAMLHKEPSGRPATAGAAIAALVAAAERVGLTVPAGMPHLPRPSDLPRREPTVFSPQPVGDDGGGRGASLALGATQLAPRRRGSWALALTVCALGLAAAFLGKGVLQAPLAPAPRDPEAVVASSAPPRPAPAPPPVMQPPAASETPAPPSDAAPPAHVALLLHGAPAGASVLLGDEPLGSAATPVRLPFGKSPLTLTVSAPGYEPLALEVVPERDREAEVKLKRRAPRPKPGGTVPSDLESPF
ncbi:MAG TPA: serine/threonine-protein kinase [Polyangiaceae bacterium]|nr:serine/threonine-protein kinase [Polyangiaceae bacterium]